MPIAAVITLSPTDARSSSTAPSTIDHLEHDSIALFLDHRAELYIRIATAVPIGGNAADVQADLSAAVDRAVTKKIAVTMAAIEALPA